MPAAVDVAEYILRRWGPMDTKKLQKLTYYSQAWHLAWGRGALFNDRIEAWRDGPVIPALYQRHRQQYLVTGVDGNAESVLRDPAAAATIHDVVDFYNPMSGTQLSDLTHVEDPWVNARRGYAPDQSSNSEITRGAIESYYRNLAQRAAT